MSPVSKFNPLPMTMNKKIYAGLLTLLPILLALAGCTQESFRPTDADTTDGSTLTIKVNAPGEDTSLRAVMSQMEDSKDFLVRFKADDKVLLFASQEGKLFKIGEVPFASLSEDGKVGTLSITLPAEIDKSKPIDLVGYNGINQSSFKGPNMVYYDKDHFNENILAPELKGRALALMPASSYNGCRIEDFNAPVIFRLKGIVPAETDMTKVEGDFEHIGAYEVVVLENRSDKPFRDPVTFSEPGTRTKKDYVYNGGFRSGVGTRYPFIDLMTGEVLELSQSSPYQSFLSRPKALAPGETGLYMTWVMPRPDVTQIPELTLAAGSYSTIVTSEGLIPARKGPMKSGIAYIGYGYWDGEHIVALDREKEERKTQYVTITTDIPVGSPITVSAYLDYSSRDAAYVDLNDNNVKDPGEAITKSFGAMEYTVSQPRISFRGAFEDLQLSKQHLTDVEISPVAALYDLDVRNNELSAGVINKIIDQLPDRSGVKPDDVHHLLLQISGNPGLEEKGVEIDLKKALNKGWSVDVPIVRSDLPQNYMELSGEPPFTLAFSVEADPAERDNVWIDLNGNGTLNEGEKIENFGSTSTNLVKATTNQLIIYGHITSLTVSYGQVKYYWGGSDNVNTEIRHLNFSGTGISACISAMYPKLETLLLADNPMLLLINTKKLPFLSNPAGLKVLDLGNSGSIIRQMNIPYDVPSFDQMTGLTYLNIQGWDWTSEQVDLSKMTKLERLIASGNKLKTIDLSGAKGLKYVELIGNQLTAETINKLLNDLPDRSGKSPGQLFIADNPGSGSGMYSIARSKNWRVDARNSISNHPARRPNMEGEDW